MEMGRQHQQEFKHLKHLIKTAPVLKVFDSNRLKKMFSDAFRQDLGAVLLMVWCSVEMSGLCIYSYLRNRMSACSYRK